MSNELFKVRVINKKKPELARKWLNYNIANSTYAKAAGWIIEDPELNEKLKANGLKPIDMIKTKLNPEAKEDVKEYIAKPGNVDEFEDASEKEESTTDKVKEELKDNPEEIDYDKLTFPELRQAAKDKGINTFGKKKTVIIEELKN